MREIIDRRSQFQGFEQSRLPYFMASEVAYLKDTVDLLGVNCYTAYVVKHIDNPDIQSKGYYADMEVTSYQPDDWPSSASSWLKVIK